MRNKEKQNLKLESKENLKDKSKMAFQTYPLPFLVFLNYVSQTVTLQGIHQTGLNPIHSS